MDILVCMKLVSRSHYTDSFRDVPGERLNTGQLVMNPADEYALELALRAREACPGGKISLMALAPGQAAGMLRTGLAMGADEAVHICDSCFAGSDTLATSNILAAAVRAVSFQGVIFCGQRAIDSETGHIGPQLAERLGLPVITDAVSLQVHEGRLLAEQVRDEGTALLLCPGQAVVTVCRGTQMVRRPTVAGLRAAGDKDLRTLTGSDLALEAGSVGVAGSPTRVVKTLPVIHRRRGGEKISEAEEGAGLIWKLLEESKGG